MIQTGLNDYGFEGMRLGAGVLDVTVALPPMVGGGGDVQPLDYPHFARTVRSELS